MLRNDLSLRDENQHKGGYIPSSCMSMFVFSRFLARATSWSVTLVHIRILEKTNKCISPCSPKILIQITRTDLLILFLNNKLMEFDERSIPLLIILFIIIISFFSPFGKNRWCSLLGGKFRETPSLNNPHVSITPPPPAPTPSNGLEMYKPQGVS